MISAPHLTLTITPHCCQLFRFHSLSLVSHWCSSVLTSLIIRKYLITTQSSHTSLIPFTSGIPQGSGLSASYTEGTPVFETYIVRYRLFADDTQSCDHCPVSAVSFLVTRLSSRVTDGANSYFSLSLQLNLSTTELIWFATHHSLAKLLNECCSLTVCLSVLHCTDAVILETC